MHVFFKVEEKIITKSSLVSACVIAIVQEVINVHMIN